MPSFYSACAGLWEQWLPFLRKLCYAHTYCQPVCCHFSSALQTANCCAVLILQHLEIADYSPVWGCVCVRCY